MLIGVASLFLLAVAASLVVISLRGKVIDAHPICRKCGFDLHGVTEKALHCPECGRSIIQKRALRIGNRRRHTRMLVVGCVMGVLGLACAAGLLPFFGSPAWMRMQPLFLLEWNLDGSQRDQAMTEFLRRYRGGMVQDEVLIRHARAALVKQKRATDDSTVFWDTASGDVIEEAILAGLLSPFEVEQYIRTVVSTQVELGDRIHPKEFHLSLKLRTALGSSGRRVRVLVQSVQFEADDPELMRQLERGGPGWRHDFQLLLRPGLLAESSGPVLLEGIAPGLKQGRAKIHIQVQDFAGMPVLTGPLTFISEFRVHIVAEDEPLIEMYSDPAEKASFEEEIMIDRVMLRPVHDGKIEMSASLHIRNAPSKLAGVLKMRLCEEDVAKLPSELQSREALCVSEITIDARREYKPELFAPKIISPDVFKHLPDKVCVELWIEPTPEAAAKAHLWRMLGDRIDLGRVEVKNPLK